MTETEKSRRLLLWVGLLTFLLMGAAQSLYGPALPMLSRETGRALADVSVVFTFHWVGSAVGVAASFALGTRLTPRWVLLSLTFGAAFLGAAQGWSMTLAGAALSGFGQGCAAVVFNPRLLMAYGARGPSMLSLLHATFGAGAIVAPMALVWLGGDYGLIFLGIAVGFALLLPGARDGARPVPTESAAPFRPDWAILAFGACGVGLEATLVGLGPSALVRSGASETQGAEAMSAFFVTFLAARIVLSMIAHRIPAFAFLGLSLAGVALCMALASVLPPLWFFVASGAFIATIFPNYFVEAAQRMGQGPLVSPVIIAGGLAGGITLPFLLAQLTESMGPSGFFQAVAALAGLMALAALAALAMRHRSLQS